MCLCCDLVLFGLFGLRMETCVIFQTLDQKVKHFHYVHMLSCGPCVNTVGTTHVNPTLSQINNNNNNLC